jgi:hypothetical protein
MLQEIWLAITANGMAEGRLRLMRSARDERAR